MRDWRAEFGLEPHGEGGWFRRLFTATPTLRTAAGERPAASSIYYLLDREQPCGRLHTNRSDILHFLIDGGPVEYVTVDPAGNGTLNRNRLGPEYARHLLVPGGQWKGSRLVDGATHALVAEVVVPGFDYADHGFVSREQAARFPHLQQELAPFLGER